jgi:hypothetical protein
MMSATTRRWVTVAVVALLVLLVVWLLFGISGGVSE